MSNREWAKNALFLDRDPDWIAYVDPTSKESIISSTQSVAERWFLENSKLTDVCLCVFEQTSVIPTENMAWRGDMDGDDNAFGDKVIKIIDKAYNEFETDPVQIMLDWLKENTQARTWISLRMNDSHDKTDDSIRYLKSDLYYQEKAAGHLIGDAYGYFGNNFDFTYPEYRNALLAYIGEILERYDFFGLSLDFLREAYCFNFHKTDKKDALDIMTEFIGEISAMLREAETKVDHPIRLMVRVPRDVDTALDFGFDVETWCTEGLVDVIEPCARWECCDSGIPITEWRQIVGKEIALVPGVETLFLEGFPVSEDRNELQKEKQRSVLLPEQAKGYAAAWLDEGADGFYLANSCNDGSIHCGRRALDLSDLHSGTRTYVVTYQDLVLEGSRYKPLPLLLSDNASKLFLFVGKIGPNDKVTVTIDLQKPTDQYPLLKVNGTECPEGVIGTLPISSSDSGQELSLTGLSPITYLLPSLETDGDLELSFEGTGTITYIQITITNE